MNEIQTQTDDTSVRIKKASSPVLSQNSQDTVNENQENGAMSANLHRGHGHNYRDTTIFPIAPTLNPAPSMLPKIKSENQSASGPDTLIPVTPVITTDAVDRQRNAQLPPQFSGFPHSPPHGHLPPPHPGHPHARYLPMMYPPFAMPPPLPPPGIGGFAPAPTGMPPQFPPPPQQYQMITPLGGINSVNPPPTFGRNEVNEQDNVATTDSTEDSDGMDTDKQHNPQSMSSRPLSREMGNPQSAPQTVPPMAAYQPVMFPTIIPLNTSNGLPMIPKPHPVVNGSKMINEDDIFGSNGVNRPKNNFMAFPPSLNHNPNIMIINQGPFGSHHPSSIGYPPYSEHKIPFPPPPPPFPLPFPTTALSDLAPNAPPTKRGIKRKRDSDGEDGDNEQNDEDHHDRHHEHDHGHDRNGINGQNNGEMEQNGNQNGNANHYQNENRHRDREDGEGSQDSRCGTKEIVSEEDNVSNYSDDMEQDRGDDDSADEDDDDDDDDDQKMERHIGSIRNLRSRPVRKRRKTTRNTRSSTRNTRNSTRKVRRTSPTRRRLPNQSNSGRQHICSYCNKAFVQNCHLSRHIREKHVNVSSRPSFECRICNKSFNQRSNLKVHLRSHALDESVSRPWLCTECYPNRRFTRKSSLKRHWIKKHKSQSAALIAELEESISNHGNLDDKMESDIIVHPGGYDAVKYEEQNDVKSEPERLRYDNGIYRIGDIEIPPEVFVEDNNHFGGHQVDESALPPLLDS